MTIEPALLLALLHMQVKHFLADFPLQTPYMLHNKGTYGHPGGFLHAGLHGVMSIPALWALGAGPGLILALVAVEFVAHYHIDWAKENAVKRLGYSFTDRGFWLFIGVDQLAHHMTLLALIAAAIHWG